MSVGNLIILYIGILLTLSIKQIFTIHCDITKGDCVADDRRRDQFCRSACFRIPNGCEHHKGADLFGKNQKYQCHCKDLRDCQFRILNECKGGCLPGYEEPYCQKRKYHEYIQNESNESNEYSHLFSSDNRREVKLPVTIRFRNRYRFNTVEIYSNKTGATMKVTYPTGMECKPKSNVTGTICTGDVVSRVLQIKGEASVYHIKLYGCPPELYGGNCTNKCHCSRDESCHQISGVCKNGCEDGWHGENCDQQTYVNIARGKRTHQSPAVAAEKKFIFRNGACSTIKGNMKSENAVDGNFDPAIIHNTCARTERGDNRYWKVNLNQSYRISQLRIYNQMKDRERLKNFTVWLGSKLCFQSKYHEHTEPIIHIRCNEAIHSDSVEIKLEGKDKMLTLCEVEVVQCVSGFYGDMCMENCNLCVNSSYDEVTGCKEGCVAGYYWDKFFRKCQECPSGLFGQDCKQFCQCSQTCNHVNGSCPEKRELPKNYWIFVIIPLILLIALIIVMAVAFWFYKKKEREKKTAKPHVRTRKISGNIYTEGISEDTAHLSEEIPLNESESACINMAGSSFKINLLKYVAREKKDVEPFKKEFLRLPRPLPLPYTEAVKPENVKKNQYKNILPYDHSRVKLQPDEISSSDYINANFISNQRYIACQGPTQSTLTDFWRMIWQLKCNTIVILKDVNAAGKTKCMQYWPDEENTEAFGTIQVKHIQTSSHSTYIHRRFFISKTGAYQNGSWAIDQFFFKKWTEHDIPQHAEYISEFRNVLKNRQGASYPLVVHCGAGVGRTGAYICIDILLNEMANDKAVDVMECITKIRQERMHMVQKRIQLECIYDVLVDNILTGDYDIDVNDIPKEFSRIKETGNSTTVSILENQFSTIIKQVKSLNSSVTLNDEEEELANFYINGVFIDGPSCENQFLVTETPMESKTVNFLRFISENSYMNVVAFFNSNWKKPNYLPTKLKESVKIGPYILELIGSEDKKICTHSVIKVKFDNKKKARIEEYQMNHFLVTIWMNKRYPSYADIVQLTNILNVQEKQVNKKFTVHSGTNFNKSGLLCIVHILKDAITTQSVINIVRLVRLIKKIQPDIIPDCESYAYIWEIAEYLQKESSLYSNFI